MIFEERNSWTEVTVPNKNVWTKVSDGGIRFGGLDLKPELLDWLHEHIGPKATVRQLGDWTKTIPLTDTFTIFSFKHHNHALLFKLTWG